MGKCKPHDTDLPINSDSINHAAKIRTLAVIIPFLIPHTIKMGEYTFNNIGKVMY